MSPAEVMRLVEVAGDRAAVYVVATYTGLRRQELKLLEWRDVHLDSTAPFVRLRAETTKSSKAVDMPLHPDVMAALRSIRSASVAPKARVFPSMVPKIPRFNRDLHAAGIALMGADGRKCISIRCATPSAHSCRCTGRRCAKPRRSCGTRNRG